MIPQRDTNDARRVSVDATWGTLQPMQVADGVRTVGELEVIDHLANGHPTVDSRAGGRPACDCDPAFGRQHPPRRGRRQD
jgi:hypothetical protein